VTRRIHWHHTGVRSWAIAMLAAVLAGCGGMSSSGSFGDVALALGSAPDANDVGVYFAQARGYDQAEGVAFKLAAPGGRSDLEILGEAALRRRPELVGVMAIVQPAKLVVAVRRDTLGEERGMVAAAVRALQRGYLQAQVEPDEAVQAMGAEVPKLDTAAVAAQLDQVSPTWSAGAPFLGALPAGREFDRTVAGPQGTNR
jgi:ABC-type nitrate/sulfonate/bicarbonate transport system substrate-binding protein